MGIFSFYWERVKNRNKLRNASWSSGVCRVSRFSTLSYGQLWHELKMNWQEFSPFSVGHWILQTPHVELEEEVLAMEEQWRCDVHEYIWKHDLGEKLCKESESWQKPIFLSHLKLSVPKETTVFFADQVLNLFFFGFFLFCFELWWERNIVEKRRVEGLRISWDCVYNSNNRF